MSQTMADEQAQLVAGEIYGKILLRDADPAGFERAVAGLSSGVAPITVAAEFIFSEEFRDKFLVNDTVSQICKKMYHFLLNRRPVESEIQQGSHTILVSGFRTFATQLLKTREFEVGAMDIPDFRDYYAYNPDSGSH